MSNLTGAASPTSKPPSHPSKAETPIDDTRVSSGGTAAVSNSSNHLEAEARTVADHAVGRLGPPCENNLRESGNETALLDSPDRGTRLSPDAQKRFGSLLRADFSHVRIHSDDYAAASAKRINALAYSIGSHIYLGRNAFSANEPHRSWLIAHELAHVLQHAQGRGDGTVHRQADQASELDRKYGDAIKRGDNPTAAEILNAFSPEDIDKRLANRDSSLGPVLTRGRIAALYLGAIENPRVGKNATIALKTRPVFLDLNYENELERGNFSGAGEFLNAFSKDDIMKRLDRLRSDRHRLLALRDAAAQNPNVGQFSQLAIVAGQFIDRLKMEQRVEEGRASGDLTLPTIPGPQPGKYAFITIGGNSGGEGTGVPPPDREPLAADTDWSKDSAYIDNNVDYCTYDVRVNAFEVIYEDKSSIYLDFDSVRGAAGRQPPPPAPSSNTTPAPAAGITRPSPPAPTTPPEATPKVAPAKPPRPGAPAFGAGGLFFRAKSSGRIYPTLLSKTSIPAIYACGEETARREPEARERFRDALIDVSVSGQQIASSSIRVGRSAAGTSTETSRKPADEGEATPPRDDAPQVKPDSQAPEQRQGKGRFHKPTVTGDPNLAPGQGFTDKYGNIEYSTAGTINDQQLALLHEKVHSALSPKLDLLRDFRADLGIAGYNRSALLKYLEEAMAETYAQLKVNGISGLISGLKFPVKEGYVKLLQFGHVPNTPTLPLAAEVAIGAIVVGGYTYSVYWAATTPDSPKSAQPAAPSTH